MSNPLIDKFRENATNKDYSEGFFSKKMKIRLAVLVLALIFLAVAKVYDNRQAEKYADLEAAAAKVAERERSDSGVDAGPAPDFTVKNFDGGDETLSSHFGKPIVLCFWATWSDESQRMLPEYDDAWEKYAGEVDFMMVNITDGSMDTESSVKKFLESGKYGFPVYFDTEHYAEVEYHVISLPVTVFIDRDGNVTECSLDRLSGAELDSAIAAIK